MTVRRTVARSALPPAAAAICAVLVLGYLTWAGHLSWARPDHRAERSLGRWGTGGTAAATDPAADPFGTRPAPLSGPPIRLKVPAIKLDTGLETLHLGDGGELTPPKDFAKAGWYADGTAPGDVGPAVIAGHVDDRSGPAVFYDLREVDAGDVIEVTRGGDTVRFTVTSTAWYPKKAFPTDEVYGPTPDRQLRLITCGGVFDRSLKSYKDNLVVYAVRA